MGEGDGSVMASRARSTSFIAPEDVGVTLGDLAGVVPDTVPAELFVSVVEALHAAHSELEALTEVQMPLSDEVTAKLIEHGQLLGTMRSAPDEWKPRLRELFNEAERASHVAESGGTAPVDEGVLSGTREVWELLRRAALTQPAVDAALRSAVIHE